MECYSVKGLSFRYPDAKKQALSDISFSVGQGEFVTVCGLSGCGKSTLLRQLKTCLQPAGERSGEILFCGRPLADTDAKTQASDIGFVFQSPEHQCVTDKVWHELAFGLESLNLSQGVIRRRVAEMASFFGMEKWFDRQVSELSGGQRQILSLASVMVMQPKVLLLDEPTAQLDPVAAAEFVSLLRRINTELSATVIISEHSLETVLPVSDRIIVISEGRVIADSTPQALPSLLYSSGDPVFLSMPAPARVYEYVEGAEKTSHTPLSCTQGRNWLTSLAQTRTLTPVPEEESLLSQKPFIRLRELWYRYERNSHDILKGLSLDINKGEFLTIIGGNGAGKTTLLSVLSGEDRPDRGRMYINGKRIDRTDPVKHRTVILPQEPQSLFVCSTVREELFDAVAALSEAEQCRRVTRVVEICELSGLLDTHPFDLSGGEQQKAALAKLLLADPDILLLDEPAKGLDCFYKRRLAEILHSLTEKGVTVIAVSHDLEFCASYSDRCALLFDGGIVSTAVPHSFFSENGIYTTAVSRMSKGIVKGAVTVPQLLASIGAENFDDSFYNKLKAGRNTNENTQSTTISPPPRSPVRSSPVRLILSLVMFAVFVFSLMVTSGSIELPVQSGSKIIGFSMLFISAAGFLAALGSTKGVSVAPVRTNLKSRVISAVSVFVLVPLTVLFGVYFLDDTKYLFISLLVMLESIAPFYIMFEKRSLRARELVLIAVICALTVAGRAVFYMLPEFKPVTAIVIIAGAALGGESGFMVGSVSMLASNIFFGQGIWTPWQMLAMGLIGYLSGVIFHSRLLPANRLTLALCGFAFALIIYGGIMNPSTLIMTGAPLNAGSLLSVYALGLPVDTVHAVATAIFLSVGALPILTKLERIKRKYDLIR